MSRLTSPSEWVAPLTPIVSLAILPLGPVLFPRAYLVLLFSYFVIFLYSQVNHLCKFFITARRMRRVIRKWNFRLGSDSSDGVTSVDRQEEKSGLLITRSREDTAASSSSRADSPNFTRDRTVLIDNNRSNFQTDFADIEDRLQFYQDPTYMHAFIIPNYCEPEGLLRDTINRLATHRNAHTHYVIILAMEAAEPDYEEKGRRLQEFFKDRFAHFIVTGHPPDIPGESRGKGSNVAYAARHGCTELMKRGIDKTRVILTVTDSDSAIPELYIREMEDALYKAEDPYHLLFAPPIFFSRNCFEVPAAVRVTDITWSAMVMSNLSNSEGLAFPCSTYSLSLMLAERVGYWDTDADSVGEDMHMFLKCFFKTDGLARTVPIYVPINLTNVQTNGYFSNMNARYVQAKRHYNGVADVAYALRHAFRLSGYPHVSKQASSSNYLTKLTVCLKVLEAHMIPVTSGWLMFAASPLMQFILFPPHSMVAFINPADNPLLISEFYATLWNTTKLITVFLPLPLFGTLAIYEHIHRTIDRDFLQKSKADSRQWKNLLDYVTLPIAAWLFMTLPSTLACFKRLRMREEQYIVSEKFFKDENPLAAKIEELV